MYFAISAAIFVVIAAAAFLLLNRPRQVCVNASVPQDFPGDDFPHTEFEVLLAEFVAADGNIDYGHWVADAGARSRLRGYLAAVAAFSPRNAPERFPDRNAELVYWLHGYNAYVIDTVLERWPINSVTDIRAPVELIRGLGFFHQLRFSFGGDFMSLLTVENRIICKRFEDARVHFVLSCASGSCPATLTRLGTGAALEQQLSRAATEFVSDPANVSIDHENRQVVLSRIFKWYKNDFLNDLRARGRPLSGGLLSYIRSVAPESLDEDLKTAVDYEIVFREYDWSINLADV